MNRFSLWLTAQPRALRMLLVINGVAYVLWQVIFIHIGAVREFVWDTLALNPGLPEILAQPWQVLTYAFLHLQPGLGGFLHVLFNMLWLVWIGRDLEELQGPSRLFGLYVIGAISGAILTIALHAAFPEASLFAGTVHGASGAVLAIMAGVAWLYPDKQIVLFLLGPVRLIHLVLGFLALDILFLAAGGTSVSAHMGGVLSGLAFARLQQRGTDLSAWARPLFERPASYSSGRRSPTSDVGYLDRLERWLSSRREGPSATEGSGDSRRKISHPGEGLSGTDDAGTRPPGHAAETGADIDSILDKISESGYDSLTADEKRTLYEASRK